MLDIKKILVPTDFSSGSRVAYGFASSIAEKTGAVVDFIHVIPSLKYLSDSLKTLGVPFDMEKDLYPHLVEKAKKMCEDDIHQHVPELSRGESIVMIDRKPSDDIIKKANEGHYDLIVMGARGSHDDGLLKWGSITEHVIRYSDVPVLSMSDVLPENGIRHILLPTDFSEISLRGLQHAIKLAAMYDGELTILHILELYGSVSENRISETGKSELEEIDKQLFQRIGDYLDTHKELRASVERVPYQLYDYIIVDAGREVLKVKFTTKVVKGISAHYEIVDFANGKVDMIVMGTHGRSGLKHLLLGSNTEKVVQHSPIPVLTYRVTAENKEADVK